jgi:hypothetical protein
MVKSSVYFSENIEVERRVAVCERLDILTK